MSYIKTTLDNGLRVITYPMPKMRSVALGIWIKVGGRYENQDNKGISHYLEHMLFKGTKKYSCRKLKESIEGIGGSLNGFTSEEYTCYLVKIPYARLQDGVSVLSDMVLNPLLNKEDMEKERTVILEEIKMYEDLPQSHVHDLLDELLYPDQPLGMKILGSFNSVNRLTDRELAEFKARHYCSANIVVSASGCLKHNELVRRIKGNFSGLKEGARGSFLPANLTQTHPKLKILDKDTEQTHLALGFHALSKSDPMRYILDILHIVIGGNMSSRLFEEVREKKGLAYEIASAIKRYHDTGVFLVHAGIDNKRVPEAIGLILDELFKIRSELIKSDELKRAKEFYLGQLMLSLEDTMDNMLWVGESLVSLDKVCSVKEIISKVNAVSRIDIRRLANRLITKERINLALIGPVKKYEDLICQELDRR